MTPALQAQFLAYDCSDEANDPANAPKDQPVIACDPAGTAKYILGPVELDGSSITDATAGMNTQNGQWVVNVVFDEAGAKTFGEVSQRLYAFTKAGQTPQNQFAFVLDGAVISAPSMNGVILDGNRRWARTFGESTATGHQRGAEKITEFLGWSEEIGRLARFFAFDQGLL